MNLQEPDGDSVVDQFLESQFLLQDGSHYISEYRLTGTKAPPDSLFYLSILFI